MQCVLIVLLNLHSGDCLWLLPDKLYNGALVIKTISRVMYDTFQMVFIAINSQVDHQK